MKQKDSKNLFSYIECPIGYYGKLCTQACRYSGFGAQCQKTCNCSEENCNHINGCMIIQGKIQEKITYNIIKKTVDKCPGFKADLYQYVQFNFMIIMRISI